MKILYAIQATGNGHVSRANEILPRLQKMAVVDVLLSGTQADVPLNFEVKYRRKGLSFVFGKKGGVDVLKTFRRMQTKKFLEEVRTLPVEDYDLVINDFEPLSAWACRRKHVPCLAMSHQFAVIGKHAPRPAKFDPLALLILKHYAPCTAGIGFHFEPYDEHTLTPVVRTEMRNAYTINLGHYTVYLPAYSDKKLVKVLSDFKTVQWHIFSKHTKNTYAVGNCWVRPINNNDFADSSSTCEGILCGAGFETPAEALHMNKKLLVVPMKNQYEQHCNAAALQQMGVPVLKKLGLKYSETIARWIKNDDRIHVNYADNTQAALDKIFELAAQLQSKKQLSTIAVVAPQLGAAV